MDELPPLATARRLLFVCTGNTCRSPLAAALARARAEEEGTGEVEVRSAGIRASRGAPVSEGSEEVAGEVGLDLSRHAATPLDRELLDWADLVLCMGVSHRLEVERLGATGGEAVLLTRFLPEEHPDHGRSIPDPVGRGVDVYRDVRRTLEAAVRGLLARLAEAREGGAR